MLGPMGSGALVAKPQLLESMPPYHGGGEMISRVWDDHSTYNTIPHKFEAGTPNVEGAERLAAANAHPQRIGPPPDPPRDQKLSAPPPGKHTHIDGERGDTPRAEGDPGGVG